MTRDENHTEALTDELLQRYHDDELSAVERAQVEARLDPDARARLYALDELGSLLREHSEAEHLEADRSAALSSSLSATLLSIERGAATSGVRPARASRRSSPLRTSALVGGLLAGIATLAFLFLPGRGTELAGNDAEVETLEVAGSVATVFRLEQGADPEQSTTVIWAALDEDEDEDADTDGVVAPTEIDEDEREAL